MLLEICTMHYAHVYLYYVVNLGEVEHSPGDVELGACNHLDIYSPPERCRAGYTQPSWPCIVV